MLGLRPVEKYRLLADAGVEKWTAPDALAAVLAYLVYCGYLEVAAGKVEIAECGKNMLRSNVARKCGILRPYEMAILEAVDNDDMLGVTAMILAIDLMPVFIGNGLYEVEKSRGLFGGSKKYLRTIKLEHTLGEILNERNAARHFNNQELDPLRAMESYAFPGLMQPDIEGEASKLVGGEAVESARPAIRAAGGMTLIARDIFTGSLMRARMLADAQSQMRPLF